MSEHHTEGRSVHSPEQRRDALVGRIFGSSIGFMEILSIHVGDRLGFYQALVEDGGIIYLTHGKPAATLRACGIFTGALSGASPR